MIERIRQWITSTGVWWLLAVGVAVLAAVPLFTGDGLLNTRGGGDSPFLLQRTHQMVAALEAGQFPVRWMPDANYGYGYPFFNFYAPLAYYIAAFFKVLGFSYVSAIQATQLLGFVVAAWGMFGVAKRWTGHGSAAFLTSVAYTFAPFHMVNVYVRGDSLSEFWAMAFYPLCLWSADVLIDRASGRTHNAGHSVLFALSFAGLILSHNISALIFTPFLALYMLIQIIRRNNRPELIATLFVAGVMGLLLSAFFWIPAIFEKGTVQLDEVTNGYFSFHNHFRPFAESLIQTSFLTIYDVGEQSRTPFSMGLIQVGLTVVGILSALYLIIQERGQREYPSIFILLLLVGSTLMILPVSAPLWEALPLVEYTQFPWRFLSVQAVATSLLIGRIIAGIAERRAEAVENRGVSTLLVTLILTGLFALLGMINLWDFDYLPVSDEEITAESLAQYEWFTGNIGTTISAEYLPKTMRPRPVTSEWLETGKQHTAYVVEGDAKVSFSPDTPFEQDFHLEIFSEEATFILPIMYWEGWKVEQFKSGGMNNPLGYSWLPLPIEVADNGLIQVTLSPLQYTYEETTGSQFVGERSTERFTGTQIRLVLDTTPTRRIAGILSIIALVWVVFACFRLFKWKLLIVPVVLAFILPSLVRSGTTVSFLPSAVDDVRTWDFDQMSYLHSENVIDFTGGERLLVGQLSQSTIQAGESFDVVLEWAEGKVETPFTLSLVSPAVHRATDDLPASIAAEYPFYLSRSTTLHTLTLPDDIPAGLYLPRITFEDGSRALTPSGKERGDLFLEPIRVLPPPPQTMGAMDETITMRVNDVVMENGDLVVDLSYLTMDQLTANYQLALSVNDSRTYFYGKHDSQPGYGFRPTSQWTPNRWVDDRIVIDWLADDGEPPYMLSAKLYHREQVANDLINVDVLFERPLATLNPPDDPDDSEDAWDVVPFEPLSELPEEVSSHGGIFTSRVAEILQPLEDEDISNDSDDSDELDLFVRGDVPDYDGRIELAGYSVDQSDETLQVMLYWRELDDHELDLTHFVHLIDDAGEVACSQCQHDSIPMIGAYSTADWETGKIVTDPAVISLNDVPPGTYRLRVGLYENTYTPALSVVDSDDSFVLLPDWVVVTE